VPKKQMAWAGGKMETSSREVALLKLLERKRTAGLALTDDQQRALASLKNTDGLKVCQPAIGGIVLKERSGASANLQQLQRSSPLVKVEVAPGVDRTIARDAVRMEARKLEKKVRECEDLERRAALGQLGHQLFQLTAIAHRHQRAIARDRIEAGSESPRPEHASSLPRRIALAHC